MIGAQCNSCEYFKVDGDCPFFPAGIPADIQSGATPHKEYRHYKTGKTWDQTPAEDK